jgi:hypothetical protein
MNAIARKTGHKMTLPDGGRVTPSNSSVPVSCRYFTRHDSIHSKRIVTRSASEGRRADRASLVHDSGYMPHKEPGWPQEVGI